MTKQEVLDALIAERFAPLPERPADNSDGPSARWETDERVVDGPWIREAS